VVTPDFYKVFFRDMEIGELNAEELRFRAARRVFELADERIGLIWSDPVNPAESMGLFLSLSLFLLFPEDRASSSLGRF
jgi:hypothetical protein